MPPRAGRSTRFGARVRRLAAIVTGGDQVPGVGASVLRRAFVECRCDPAHGSVELAPLTGLADCVLDITATGRTLAANNLVEIVEAGASTARLIANHAALKTRNEQVGAMAVALRRAAAARHTAGAA